MLKTNIVRHGLGIGAIYKCGREIMETNRSITLQSTTLYMAAPPPLSSLERFRNLNTVMSSILNSFIKTWTRGLINFA